MLGPPAGSKKTYQQCRLEKIADVLNGITRGQITGMDDVPDMDDGGAYAQDGDGNDGCLAEAIAAAHGDNPEDTNSQIGKADLKLKGISGRPADGLGHRVRDEHVAEKPPIPLPATPTPKMYSKKISSRRSRLRPLLSRPRWPTATMSGSME